jgi:hypothetical protein
MLRVSKGNEERHVWPVHLPGWLAIGWRVVGAKEAAATADVRVVGEAAGSPVVVLPLEPEKESNGNARTASTRGKRGRRSKEELTPEAAADAAPLSPSASPDTEEAPLMALPEDLLDDPLI